MSEDATTIPQRPSASTHVLVHYPTCHFLEMCTSYIEPHDPVQANSCVSADSSSDGGVFVVSVDIFHTFGDRFVSQC